jgi:cell wall assembly regulator SMI1
MAAAAAPAPPSPVVDLWRRYERWLEKNMPDAYWDLGPPATLDTLADTEDLIERKLPADLREFYRVHNGQRGQATGIVGNWRLMPLAEVVREWQLWNEMMRMQAFAQWTPRPDMGIKNVWWSAGWLPLTSDGQGNHHCLDLDPDSSGQRGQMIVVYSDNEVREVLATSFTEWLSGLMEGLEQGRFATGDTEEGSVFLLPGLIET